MRLILPPCTRVLALLLVVSSTLACGPDRRRGEDDPAGLCGDGKVDPGETCDPAIASGDGACPSACDDGVACTKDAFTGSGDECTAECSHTPIAACAAADGCCPGGCTPSTDPDCSTTCGNGRIEPGETCDKGIASGDGACVSSCVDEDACTSDVSSGSVETCSAACTHARVTACVSGDGCCPGGCASTTDADCAPVCGNGVVEAGETCDGDCPSDCSDGVACTTDALVGDPLACTAACAHDVVSACISGDSCCAQGCRSGNDSDCAAVCGNGFVEPGETCDGNCPATCDDANACTTDAMGGAAASCNASCTNTRIAACVSGDGCCPSGCTVATDGDCNARCGNGAVESGETCDGNCPASCSDADACTIDSMTGSAASCNAACANTRITSCANGDGCCPSGCGAADDSDCTGAPRAGETCAAAAPLAPGTYTNLAIDGFANDVRSGTGCKTTDGGDGFFSVAVPAGRRLFVTITPTSGASAFDPVLSLVAAGSCAAPRCLASRDAGYDGEAETAVWVNTGATSEQVVIWIDEYSTTTTRTFDLAVEVAPPAAGETCAAPVLVNASGSLPAQSTSLGAEETAAGPGCVEPVSARRIYAIDVPPGMHLDASAEPASSTLDLTLDLVTTGVASCRTETASCSASSDSPTKGVTEAAGWTNASASTVRVHVIVGSVGGVGSFTLTTAVVAPAPGDSCGNALAIAQPGTLSNQSFAGALDDYGASGYCGGTAGVDRVYAMAVPAGQRLTVTATSPGAPPPMVTLVPGATAGDCAASAGVCAQAEAPPTQTGAPTTVRWTNATGATSTTFVRVDATSSGASFDLVTALDTPAAGAGETCLTATVIPVGTLTGTTVGNTDDYAASTSTTSGCSSLASSDRVYSISVPAGRTLVAILRPESGFDASLSAIAGSAASCDGNPRQCVAGSDVSGAGGAEAIRYANTGTAAKQVFLVVDGHARGAAGSYTLTTTLDPLPGDTCANAVALTLPANLPSESIAGYGGDYVAPSSSCTGYETDGPERVYSLRVPAGKTLTVTLQPADRDFDPAIWLTAAPAASCATPTCVAGRDDGADGAAETLTYANTGADVDVFLVVEHVPYATDTSASNFALTATLSP